MEKQQLINEIIQLKKETGAVVMAHTYQRPEIIDLADVTGDSFKLAQFAAKGNYEKVILCGVRFMAETAKAMSPDTSVILPAPKATCPMAEQISPEEIVKFREENPDVAVVCYINTTIELKAVCDVCVTSSSAVNIVKNIPSKKILFLPDKNLGSFVAKMCPEKEVIIWNGCCPVHNAVPVDEVKKVMDMYPNTPVAVHPECPKEIVDLADLAGSTAEIIDFAKAQKGDVIIVTERQVANYLNEKIKDRKFITPCPEILTCKDMDMTDLETLCKALKGEGGEEIELDEDIRIRAKKSIDRMLELG